MSAYADADDSGRGAYVRVYGLEDGTSLFFGLPVNASNTKVLNWQDDGASSKSYDVPSFGRFTDNDNIKQSELYKNVMNYPAAEVTPAPAETDAPVTVSPSDTTTAAPVVTDAPAVTTTEPPKETTAKAPEVTTQKPVAQTTAPNASTTAPEKEEKSGCGSTVGMISMLSLAVSASAYIVLRKKK